MTNKKKLTTAMAEVIAANLARKAVDDENEKLMRGLIKQRDDWLKWRRSGKRNVGVINGVRR